MTVSAFIISMLVGWVLVDWWRIMCLQKQVENHNQELEAIAARMDWSCINGRIVDGYHGPLKGRKGANP